MAEVVGEASRKFLALADSASKLTGDLTHDLTSLATLCNDCMEHREDLGRALIGESRRQPNLAKELIGDVMPPIHHRIADYLAEHQRGGAVRQDVDTAAFAEILTATLMAGVLRRGSGLSAYERGPWIRRTVEFLTRGILSKSHQP